MKGGWKVKCSPKLHARIGSIPSVSSIYVKHFVFSPHTYDSVSQSTPIPICILGLVSVSYVILVQSILLKL